LRTGNTYRKYSKSAIERDFGKRCTFSMIHKSNAGGSMGIHIDHFNSTLLGRRRQRHSPSRKFLHRRGHACNAGGAAAVNATSAKALKAEVTNDARSHSVVSDSTPATPIAHTTVRIPLVWDEEATERFNELVMLKATGNTSSEENLEFQELYDAREEYLDQTPVADRIKELRRKRAFSTLIEAFDQYVIAEKVAY